MTAASPARARAVPAVVAILLVAATVALVRKCVAVCDGRLIYPLDDTYIHMTMARNLAHHGSWGITPGVFAPASSSPLWTLLLAALTRAFGVRDALPLVLAIACMIVLILVMDRFLRGAIPHPFARGAVLVVILATIGLPGLAVTGMEPVLHMLLALSLAWSVASLLAGVAPVRGSPLVPITILAGLAVLTRFESLFLVGTLAVAAALRRRTATAGALILGAGVAVAGYMAFALPQGGSWLPDSVLLNAPLAQPRPVDPLVPFMSRIPDALQRERSEHPWWLLLGAAWLLLPRRQIASPHATAARILLAVMSVTLLLHMQLALFDAFFRRYEAYLVTLGAFGVAVALACGLGGLPDGLVGRLPRVPAGAVALLAGAGFALPFLVRDQQLVRWTPLAAQNIHEQQYQMARLVREGFRDRAVAINDLGAVSYYGQSRIVDLCGLGTMPIARAIIERRYDTSFIERYCAEQGVELAMVYESWFREPVSLPRAWERVGRWTIRDNLIAGDATVTLFATDAAAATRVRAAVSAFAATLPRSVLARAVP